MTQCHTVTQIQHHLFVYWILLLILLDSEPPSSAARSALVSSRLSWERNLVQDSYPSLHLISTVE